MKQNKESQNIEYKESWRDEYLKWICGFANAQGGKIFIGVNDNKEVVGLANVTRLMEDIPNKVVNFLGLVVDVNLHVENNKDYIEIVVEPSNIPIALKGVYHYRSGSTKQELKGIALEQFILKKMGRSWDDVQDERASIEDIDRTAVDYFLKKAIASNRMPAESLTDTTEAILQSLNFIQDNGKIKNAALLLFGKRPSKFFTSSDFRIGRFIKDDSDLIFQDVVEGNLIQMADKVIDILRSKYLTSPISYRGLDRIERLEIPEEALRELIFNAIIHKDYMGVHIQLKVFNDYMWLWNPGELPEHLGIENLMSSHTSHPRNRNIANVFYKAGFIESWGRGINKVTTEFKKANLPIPKFQSAFGGLLVTIPRQNSLIDSNTVFLNASVRGVVNDENGTVNNENGTVNNENGTVNEENGTKDVKSILLKTINANEGLSAPLLAQTIGKSLRTTKRYIKDLSEVVEFRGSPKKGGYFIKK